MYDEARGESDAGRSAVARVVMNRKRMRYASDGTMLGTVLRKNQFSGFWFDFRDGKYVRVCNTPAEAYERAVEKLRKARESSHWAACVMVAKQAMNGFYMGPAASRLTPDTVLYLNAKLVKLPDWADPAKLVAVIGNHSFYRD